MDATTFIYLRIGRGGHLSFLTDIHRVCELNFIASRPCSKYVLSIRVWYCSHNNFFVESSRHQHTKIKNIFTSLQSVVFVVFLVANKTDAKICVENYLARSFEHMCVLKGSLFDNQLNLSFLRNTAFQVKNNSSDCVRTFETHKLNKENVHYVHSSKKKLNSN